MHPAHARLRPRRPAAFRGDIQPGIYEDTEIVGHPRQHCHNPEAIYFIADLLEDQRMPTQILVVPGSSD